MGETLEILANPIKCKEAVKYGEQTEIRDISDLLRGRVATLRDIKNIGAAIKDHEKSYEDIKKRIAELKGA